MENSNAWRGEAGTWDAKSAIDADHSGGCFPHRGGPNAGFGGPAEGVLKISASKIFDQWLTAHTHEGSHAQEHTLGRHSPVAHVETELNGALWRFRQQDSVVEVQDTLMRTHDHTHTATLSFSHRNTDRIQPTPIWCTVCPAMHSCKRLSAPYPKWSWQAQLTGVHMLATAIWTLNSELMLSCGAWANFLHRLTKYTKSSDWIKCRAREKGGINNNKLMLSGSNTLRPRTYT